MTRLIEILIALAIVAALFLLVGIALPSERNLTESVETNRKMTIVYDTLANMRRFDDWNPVVLRGAMQKSVSDPAYGEGASFSWTSDDPAIGDGSWTLVEAVPGQRLVFALDNNHAGSDKTMTFELEPTGRNNRNVKITQSYHVDYGWNILGRYEGLYVARNVGDAVELGLGRLTNMLATIPNFDYAVLEEQPKVVERPAENVLFVPSTVDRDNDVVLDQMQTNRQWIQKVIQDNGLEAVGPMRVVTVEFGAENYAFELEQPVRRAGTGPSASDDAAGDAEGEGEGEATAVAEAPATDATQIDVDLQGPVEYRYTQPHRAAMAHLDGHMANLPTFRDGIRAWALTQGYETTGRPYEEWNAGLVDSFTEDGDFDVYWPLKDE